MWETGSTLKSIINSTEDKLFISKPLVGRASGQWSGTVYAKAHRSER